VDEHEVDVIDAERGQRLVDRGHCLVVVLDLSCQLGGHEQLRTGDAGRPDTVADAAFVAVGLGGVDVAVADVDRGAHSVCRSVVVDEPGAEPQLGDLDTVGQGVGLV